MSLAMGTKFRDKLQLKARWELVRVDKREFVSQFTQLCLDQTSWEQELHENW